VAPIIHLLKGAPHVSNKNALDSLLLSTHSYDRFRPYVPDAAKVLADVVYLKGADSYGIERVFRSLLLKFIEDLSDRETTRYRQMEENFAAK
jgi:hypothetical protein